MKPAFAFAALLFLTPAVSSVRLFAEDAHDSQKMEEMKEKRMNKLTEELKLTPDQQKSVREALDKKHEKMKALRDEHMAKMKAIDDETDNKINAVLTADQKPKYAEMKKKMQERREDHKEEWHDKMKEHK